MYLKSNIEIEFSFGEKSWADQEKLDKGTRKVVSEGFKIIYDPEQILNNLTKKVHQVEKTI